MHKKDAVDGGQRSSRSGRHQFFFLLEIFLKHLLVCYFVAPSMTRGRVCNLLLLLVLASAVPLESESRGTQDHILLSQFLRLPEPVRVRVTLQLTVSQSVCLGVEPNLGSPYLYPPGTSGLDIPPGTGFPSRRLILLARLRWRQSIPPPHGISISCSSLALYIN
jgi:hypothetical protein